METKKLLINCADMLSISEDYFVPISIPFTTEAISSLGEYGEVLRKIHRRLISEGYIVDKGRIYKPADGIIKPI